MTTENLAINAGSGDTYQSGSTSNFANSNMLLNAGGRYGAWRWPCTVPQGATITSATLSVWLNNSSYVDPVGTFYGLDADNVAAFDGTDNEVTDKGLTTASLGWNASGLTHNQYYEHDVTSIIQEIVNRGGWSAGNGIGICYLTGAGALLRFPQYDGDSSHPALLDIVYTTAAAAAHAGGKIRRARLAGKIGGSLA